MTKLHELFKAQQDLMTVYTSLGKLCEFPVLISSRRGQEQVKEIGGYFIEELAEAHSSYILIYTYAQSGNSKEAIKCMEDYNEELADCLHFILEVMILTNITAEDVLRYMELELSDFLTMCYEENPWEELFIQARRINLRQGINFQGPSTKTFTLNTDSAKRFAGRYIGLDTISAAENLLWKITYCLKLSENILKIKPWKEDMEQVDFKDYHQKIMSTFISFLEYCEGMGCSSESLFQMYNYKNQINHQRIKDKY